MIKHDFRLMKNPEDKKYLKNYEKNIEIDDKLILYISDTLKWINTLWADNQQHIGIDYYGYSIFFGRMYNETQQNFKKLAFLIF
jgi:hypothetical protein